MDDAVSDDSILGKQSSEAVDLFLPALQLH